MLDHITSNDGTTIGFWRSGSGPPLLLVHGTTADHRRWSRIAPGLEAHFCVYTMDRRGRGESGDAPAYELRREAEDVAAVVEAVGEPVFVLAHSYGAVCSLEAARLTDKIGRLILYEPPIPTGLPQYPPDIPARMQQRLDQGEQEAALEIFMGEIVRMPEHELAVYRQLPMWSGRIQLAPTIPREIMLDQTYQFDPNLFTTLQTPTLLLLGGDSPPLFERAIQRLDTTLPNSRVVILPGQQHVAMDTSPELFVSEVLNFLLVRG